ncbi:uracil-DNA glycosylase family protein [Acanthopleuribacter pedis]|uniref:Uracil-DNA glycosylase-like domain-containing protein n=1 Tax=Acanthopleuribacter pedis TaxID=442870 RepID=A0A8J7U835_9BACT|nr:uracil-DNA glycosylase family protein [Acanthopleuribacter pedis]MBO1323158.1 hypothetical protein [Acanthopleuribacter pedis]
MNAALDSLRHCTACNLYRNQQPLIAKSGQPRLMWIGISAQKADAGKRHEPLAPDTKTGSVLAEIEARCGLGTFYKTNLVKCLPLDNDGKIRYPSQKERHACYPNLQFEWETLRPEVLILLGRQPADYLAKQMRVELPPLSKSFDYQLVQMGTMSVLPIHHPSYILIYKRKLLEHYQQKIADCIMQRPSPNGLFERASAESTCAAVRQAAPHQMAG